MALASLAALKAWLKVTVSDDDVLLSRLLDQVSGAILNSIQRPVLTRATYPEQRSGVGNQRITLRNWPVLSVAFVTVEGVSIPAASGTQNGYSLMPWDGTPAGNPQQLTLKGYWFCRGLNNIVITYDAGYCVADQAATIPASSQYQIVITPPLGPWAQDDGVTFSDGTALTPVTSNPAQGQYSVTPGGFGPATYTFNSADAGKAVLISYSYTPSPLEQACIEWAAERYRYKDRIGQRSMSLGGNETAAYNLQGIPDFVEMMIAPFRKDIPL